MEDMQLFKYCPWVSKEVNVKEYFSKYNSLLNDVFSPKSHNEELDKEEVMRNFFHNEDLDELSSRRNTPTPLLGRNICKAKDGSSCSQETGKFSNAAVSQLEREPNADPFNLLKLENDCSIDLLTDPDEISFKNIDETGLDSRSGRLTNWYAGVYMDGYIPDGATEKLQTLAHQEKELYKRETVKDYTRLRHRLLKYASTVRMVVNENSMLDVPPDEKTSCMNEVIFNVRIHRPFHKKCYQRKGVNRFPKHSQEMYMLGSQKLSELKEALLCINKSYVHFDMSNNPDISACSQMTSAEELFPSDFFYIDGVFYNDLRNPKSKDNSEILLKWASRYPNIGKFTSKLMNEATLGELNIRLGYPYVYQHLGNCEHLIVFTDVRLLTRKDVQDPSRYPLSRGNPVKLSITCSACNHYLACWILKDHPKFPEPYTHLCQKCLQLFCYDKNGKKKDDFKLYPFIDEFLYQQKKGERCSEDNHPRFEIMIHET